MRLLNDARPPAGTHPALATLPPLPPGFAPRITAHHQVAAPHPGEAPPGGAPARTGLRRPAHRHRHGRPGRAPAPRRLHPAHAPRRVDAARLRLALPHLPPPVPRVRTAGVRPRAARRPHAHLHERSRPVSEKPITPTRIIPAGQTADLPDRGPGPGERPPWWEQTPRPGTPTAPVAAPPAPPPAAPPPQPPHREAPQPEAAPPPGVVELRIRYQPVDEQQRRRWS